MMHHSEQINHEANLGCTKGGTADPCQAFAADLHEILMKHTVMMAQGRAVGIEIAVSPKLAKMLSECDGADAYIHNLHQVDDNARSNGNAVFEGQAHALVEAGYVPGQTYEQCLAMAAWHPGMRRFMSGCGPDGSDQQRQQFGYAQMYLLGDGFECFARC